MLAVGSVSRLFVRVARRAVVVEGQRQAAIQAVRRRDNVSIRGIQSVAQTDRVRGLIWGGIAYFHFLNDRIQLRVSYILSGPNARSNGTSVFFPPRPTPLSLRNSL
jgi:hypothetical protein